ARLVRDSDDAGRGRAVRALLALFLDELSRQDVLERDDGGLTEPERLLAGECSDGRVRLGLLHDVVGAVGRQGAATGCNQDSTLGGLIAASSPTEKRLRRVVLGRGVAALSGHVIAALLALRLAIGEALGLSGQRLLVLTRQEQVAVLSGDAVLASDARPHRTRLRRLVLLLEVGDPVFRRLRALGLRLQVVVVRVLRPLALHALLDDAVHVGLREGLTLLLLLSLLVRLSTLGGLSGSRVGLLGVTHRCSVSVPSDCSFRL